MFLAREQFGRWEAGVSALPAELPVYVAPRSVMGAVAGFPIHRGVLALGRRLPVPDVGAICPPGEAPFLALGAVGLTNHDNVGGLFRNAAAFGVDAVILDAATCDPLYRKAIRVSSGAALTVPFARGAAAGDLIDGLIAAGIEPVALSPRGDEPLHAFAPPPRLALLVGTEGEGLPAPLLAQLRTLRVAMSPGFDSLNVATAAAIALHHVFARRPLRA